LIPDSFIKTVGFFFALNQSKIWCNQILISAQIMFVDYLWAITHKLGSMEADGVLMAGK
jgi:hypothetical protein